MKTKEKVPQKNLLTSSANTQSIVLCVMCAEAITLDTPCLGTTPNQWQIRLCHLNIIPHASLIAIGVEWGRKAKRWPELDGKRSRNEKNPEIADIDCTNAMYHMKYRIIINDRRGSNTISRNQLQQIGNFRVIWRNNFLAVLNLRSGNRHTLQYAMIRVEWWETIFSEHHDCSKRTLKYPNGVHYHLCKMVLSRDRQLCLNISLKPR